MNAHRVIRHTFDEDERAGWALRSKQWGGPVEIASGPASVVLRLGRIRMSVSFGGGYFLVFSWLVRLLGQLSAVWPRIKVLGERMTEESYATSSWNQPPVKFKAERRSRGWYIGSREGFFWF